jgi:predicted Zn-dependent protease
MSFVDKTQDLFRQLKSSLFNELHEDEELGLNLIGEDSLFVRFNNSRVRQNTTVEQRQLEMHFQKNSRRVLMNLDLCGDYETDLALCRSLLQRARREVAILPEDPGVSPLENRGTSQNFEDSRELDFEEVLKVIRGSAEGTDFTGFLAAGPQIRANANSRGQEHWFSTRSFFLDYSLFTVNESNENKAVKGNYADKEWSSEKFLSGLASAKNQLALLKRPSREVKPGAYRVYLAPGAVSELIQMLSWNALSYSAYKKGGCAFARMADGQETLSSKFSLRENFDLGLTPPFNNLGEVPPRQIDLIENGRLKQFLVSTRSAREYGVESNCADMNEWGQESLRSPELRPGDMPEKEALRRLGTGLYLSNLHYCNWSDVQAARVTGMTRYACFWVENGEIAAPIRDLRFDESLYSAFGKELEAVTKEQHIDPNVDTYFRRSLGGKFLPGLLVGKFQFTL